VQAVEKLGGGAPVQERFFLGVDDAFSSSFVFASL